MTQKFVDDSPVGQIFGPGDSSCLQRKYSHVYLSRYPWGNGTARFPYLFHQNFLTVYRRRKFEYGG